MRRWISVVMVALVFATGLVLVVAPPASAAALPASKGYWFVGGDGGVFGFGEAGFFGSTGATRLNRPIVGMAATPTGRGYWLVASDGGLFSFGDAGFYGSAGDIRLNRPIVAMSPTSTGKGYWLVASDGGIFAYGDAVFRGSTGAITLNKPIVAMATTASGRGYWLIASDGGVFSFGDAVFRGSAGNVRLNRPIVGVAPTPSGRGYWLVASDGGVFSYGDAVFRGSTGAIRLNQPIVAVSASPRGSGYWMVASDGGVFAFGDAGFAGSTGGRPLQSPIVGMVAAPVRGTPEVAAFYYPWYASVPKDGMWRHWEGNGKQPPNDLAANFYPARGAYSSTDVAVLDAQMSEMVGAGINLVVTSWWGRESFEDKGLPAVVAAAAARGLRLAVHLEPYPGRSVASMEADVAYLRTLGVREVWLYNIQGFPSAELGPARARMGADIRVFGQGGNPTSVKSGAFAAFAQAAGFDGIYTYDVVRYSPAELAGVCATARLANLLCSPSVGPGYEANRTKPFDTQLVPREGGLRYDAMWAAAIDAGAEVVSITSYNEWHEGTQIEPAVPYCFGDGFCSSGYEGAYGIAGAGAPGAYLNRTAYWSSLFRLR